MKFQLRICTLAAILAAATPAFAQEDPPFPEDPEPQEQPMGEPEPEAVDTAPVSTSAPVGTVEVVGETKAAATPAPAATPTPAAPEATTEAAAPAPVEEDQPKDRLRTEFVIKSAGAMMNNLDFRPLNNETYIDIEDSDDRETLLYTSLGADVEYDVLDDTTVAIGASHGGVWGGDSIGAANAFGGVFYVTHLNVEWMPVASDSFSLGMRIGRQQFGIGGAVDDYFLDDVIDGVVLEAGFGKGGKLRLVPLDMFQPQQPDDLTFGSALGYGAADGPRNGFGFDGDAATLRFGGVYENTELVDGLSIRAFGYYADIGAGAAPHTGADKVFYGAHGNFSDNDYNWMAGTRIGYDLGNDGQNGEPKDSFRLGVYGEFGRSGGLDRKATQIGVRDIAADGNAFGGAVTPTIDLDNLDIRLLAQFFMADGASYTEAEGLAFNYGFVGMKGNKIGGLNMSKTAGWRPSAYVGGQGVSFAPQDTSRKAGTMLVHGGLGVDVMEKLSLDFDLYWFKDNSNTGIKDFDNLDQLADELPFGYTEADLIPQERLGKSLGMEIDARAGYAPSEALSFFAQYGVFMPGAFYQIEIPRTGGTALGAEDPASFWAMMAGAQVTF